MNENKKLPAEVQERSAGIDKALLHVTSLYLEHDKSTLTNKALNRKLKNYEELIMYNFQSSNLSMVLESLLDFVFAAFGITKPEPLIIAMEELDGKKDRPLTVRPIHIHRFLRRWIETTPFLCRNCFDSVIVGQLISVFHARVVLYR